MCRQICLMSMSQSMRENLFNFVMSHHPLNEKVTGALLHPIMNMIIILWHGYNQCTMYIHSFLPSTFPCSFPFTYNAKIQLSHVSSACQLVTDTVQLVTNRRIALLLVISPHHLLTFNLNTLELLKLLVSNFELKLLDLANLLSEKKKGLPDEFLNGKAVITEYLRSVCKRYKILNFSHYIFSQAQNFFRPLKALQKGILRLNFLVVYLESIIVLHESIIACMYSCMKKRIVFGYFLVSQLLTLGTYFVCSSIQYKI